VPSSSTRTCLDSRAPNVMKRDCRSRSSRPRSIDRDIPAFDMGSGYVPSRPTYMGRFTCSHAFVNGRFGLTLWRRIGIDPFNRSMRRSSPLKRL
jgi:hypothetical protein